MAKSLVSVPKKKEREDFISSMIAEKVAEKQPTPVHNIPEQEAPEESGFDTEGFAVDDLPFEQPHTQTVFYRVVATPEELEQVEIVFNSIGIFFERRDENE